MNPIASELRAVQAREVDARRADACARTRGQHHREQAARHAQSAFEAALQKARSNGPVPSRAQHRAADESGDAAKAQDTNTSISDMRPGALTAQTAEQSASDRSIGSSTGMVPVDRRPIAPLSEPACTDEALAETDDRVLIDLGDRGMPVRGFALLRGPGIPLRIELHARGPSTAATLESSLQTLHQRLPAGEFELSVGPTAADTDGSSFPMPHRPAAGRL